MTRILVADDIPANIYLLEATLKGYGYEVVSARNGLEAINRAVEEPPDLIITDILMPVMDGFELCRRWMANDRLKDIPFMFYTATYTDPKDEKFARSLGADRFLVKPQQPEVIADAVRTLLEESRKGTVLPLDPSTADEKEVLRQYNEVLFRKLEKKVMDLEADIAERRRIEEELAEKEQFLDTIIENIPDMIFVKDAADLRYVRLNKACADMLGYTPEEINGRNDHDIFPRDEAESFIAEDRAVLREGRPVDIPQKNVTMRNKGRRICHTRKVPICDREGNPKFILGISEDITTRVTIEEALNRATRKLSLLNGITFDEIQNSIYSLAGYFELERNLAGGGKFLHYIEKQAMIMETIRDSLAFARTYQELGQKPPSWQSIQLTFLYAISHIEMKGISRDVKLDGLEVYADPLLEKVFSILADNVVRHSRGATEISLLYSVKGDQLVLAFQDNGNGIPGEMKDKIFLRRCEGKNGMGLFLAREILSITNVMIHETGEAGKGARFEITVPKGSYRFSASLLPSGPGTGRQAGRDGVSE